MRERHSLLTSARTDRQRRLPGNHGNGDQVDVNLGGNHGNEDDDDHVDDDDAADMLEADAAFERERETEREMLGRGENEREVGEREGEVGSGKEGSEGEREMGWVELALRVNSVDALLWRQARKVYAKLVRFLCLCVCACFLYVHCVCVCVLLVAYGHFFVPVGVNVLFD